ncbi:sugar phosphate nucleotidyltransferase [Actinacidiphila sp. bgisy144]|uniref:sugar phosphate nucleotidyltransferase n=1 Tax=unclassified Actinacidiphila TaxID=2995708 RepID=UPI003EBD4913
MKALILANGRADRLGPLSLAAPKALLPVANRPVIWYVIQSLREAGVEEIAVTVGPRTRAIAEFVEPLGGPACPVRCLWERRRTGTGGALRDHLGYMEGEPIVVVPADIIAGVDIRALVRQHLAHPASVTVAVARQDPARWDGDFLVTDGPVVTEYLFKPGAGAPTALGSTGAWVVRPDVVPLIPRTGFCDFSAQVLPGLPGAGRSLGAYDAGVVYQRDVGVPQRYWQGNIEAVSGSSPASRYLPGPSPAAPRGGATVVRGPVLIAPDVTAHPSARIYGPAVLGRGAVIGAHTSIVSSVVLPGAEVPPYSLLSGSVFGTAHHLDGALLRPDTAGRADRLVGAAGGAR